MDDATTKLVERGYSYSGDVLVGFDELRSYTEFPIPLLYRGNARPRKKIEKYVKQASPDYVGQHWFYEGGEQLASPNGGQWKSSEKPQLGMLHSPAYALFLTGYWEGTQQDLAKLKAGSTVRATFRGREYALVSLLKGDQLIVDECISASDGLKVRARCSIEARNLRLGAPVKRVTVQKGIKTIRQIETFVFSKSTNIADFSHEINAQAEAN